MADPIISVEHLSKEYIISHRPSYGTLRDTLTEQIQKPFRRTGAVKSEEFWALKDVNFSVQPGDRVGIIGRNGAGKSTLLKILSQITPPTSGRVTLRGRVASLLEVGTGFHPELTGRENIALNGAILGMSRKEISRKFDEIVAFSEIEKFLDTPVKRYSSGMYVRLAFAVAAHLDSEILIVDEVLAVGDIQFQKKCLSKMNEISGHGRTVLFVSHNMPSIISLTETCLLLNAGQLLSTGSTSAVVHAYQNVMNERSMGQANLSQAEHYGSGRARFTSIHMQARDQAGQPLLIPVPGSDLHFEVEVEAKERVTDVNVGLTIYSNTGVRLIDANTTSHGDTLNLEAGRRARVIFDLQKILLRPEVYTVGLWMGKINHEDIDGLWFATSFDVQARPQDIKFAPPFPGSYLADFSHKITIG